MTRALIAGEAGVAFCGVRPSGHHAESGRAMGFCLFNNVAVAAAAAISEHGLERVLVLDWDVHHGNGTEQIFARRADVLTISLHQSPLYPGTGRLDYDGEGPGAGYTINLPVPPGTGEAEWMELFDRIVMPAARAYAPQLILVSSGFDAHAADPLAECRLRTETFAIMAGRLRELCAGASIPLGVVLEGGYAPTVLAEAVCALLPVLADEAEPPPALVTASGCGPLTERAIARHGLRWPLG
jgi:acetoin utilization deacetylase AcuC-like enzyme